MSWKAWFLWWGSQSLSIGLVLMLLALLVLSGCQTAQPMGEDLWLTVR